MFGPDIGSHNNHLVASGHVEAAKIYDSTMLSESLCLVNIVTSLAVVCLLTLCLVIWRILINRYGGFITSSLDTNSLAKISDGYTIGQIARACEEVLTRRRTAQLMRRRLIASEFIPPLAQMDPVYIEEEEAFKVSSSALITSPRLAM